jgi:co-chaperonin GroES (HSP10)
MELTANTVLTLERWENASPIEKQDIVSDLTQRLFALHRSFQPRHPWVLVYVLPREQKIGSLYIPGKHQKVSLEGVVLATWNEWAEEKGVVEQGVRWTRVVVHRSELEVGQHVVFPHWSGLPIPGMDEEKFRIVKELGWSKNEEGGVFGTIEYDEPYLSEKARLRALIEDVLSNVEAEAYPTLSELPGLLAAQIEQQFLLVDKSRSSVTLSAFGKDK